MIIKNSVIYCNEACAKTDVFVAIYYGVFKYISNFKMTRHYKRMCGDNKKGSREPFFHYASIPANFSFKIRLKKNVHKNTDAISAIGYDHHTISSPNNLAKINATGMMINNCLAIEISILYTPFPNAWKTELQMIE